MEYSAKLSNCYDNQDGFNGHYIYNSSVSGLAAGSTRQFTNNATIINTTILTNNNNNNKQNNSNQLMSQELQMAGNVAGHVEMNALNSKAFQQSAPPVSGWKCCCWNATNLVSRVIFFY